MTTGMSRSLFALSLFLFTCPFLLSQQAASTDSTTVDYVKPGSFNELGFQNATDADCTLNYVKLGSGNELGFQNATDSDCTTMNYVTPASDNELAVLQTTDIAQLTKATQ